MANVSFEMESKSGTDLKKFSLSLKNVSASKKSAFNKDLVQDVEKKEETDFVTEVRGNSIKGSLPKEKKKVFVIPALENDNALTRKLRLKDGQQIEREIQNEILNEAEIKIKEEPLSASDEANAPVISAKGGNVLDLSLETQVEPPTMDAYDQMPIEEFGTALLRGMGWKPGQAIGARCAKAAKPIEVKLRPKGLGLGAEQLLRSAEEQKEYENRRKANKEENLVLKVGAFVKVIGSTHEGKYGQVTGMDEDSGRVHLSLAITKEKVSCNEAFVMPVSKQDYNEFGKCLNRDRYDDYKRKHEGEHNSRKTEKIDLSSGFKEKKQKTSHSKNDKKQDAEKRAFIGYWLKSQLRVRIIDEKFKKGKHVDEKVIIEDVLKRDVCLCRTESGRLLEDVHMDMLETVLPRSASQSSTPVMVVAGKYEGQIGYIVDRDKKNCTAYVQFAQDKSVHKFEFDYICEYVGHM